MLPTRDNHYVPRWYQAGFFEPGRNTLAYLDLKPPQKTLDDGRVITGNSLIHWPTSRCFQQKDLYSTFFGTIVSDEIERKLFGDLDAKGAQAVRAFCKDDQGGWHQHFQTLFQYIDAQKIRTPKGLDWLQAQYPALTQNDLMFEMQGIRSMHCTIWAEGVREIASAEDSDIKFIISDHPVTIYNHAVPPAGALCAYPLDPSTALKASQTIFPLSRDFCLILTNLEYAQKPDVNPLEKRTFARNYRQSMVRTDAFIHSRKLAASDVARINRIIRARARRFIAAGRKEWLHPDETEDWRECRHTLLPPENELFHYGGEMYVKYEGGHVHYQDAFGRTEQERDYLKKPVSAKPLRPNDICGCGSGRRFKDCCASKPPTLRPTWTERSIRERNIMFSNALQKVLGTAKNEKDWVTIRREMTDEKIAKIYSMYEGLWPEETDLLKLLPKPDGMPRAVYTGAIHPDAIGEYALGASLYFGELIIQHPFVNARTLQPKYNPVKTPSAYRQEVLKSIAFLYTVMPLVDLGLVNLIPDPCDFDMHLRQQMLYMARSRSAGVDPKIYEDDRTRALMREDTQRGLMSMPQRVLLSQMKKAFPDKSEAEREDLLQAMLRLQEQDPLAVLQQEPFESGKVGGSLGTAKLAPNFEMAMYLAQATGASIVTDSPARWQEMLMAAARTGRIPTVALPELARAMRQSSFAFPQTSSDIARLSFDDTFATYRQIMRDTFKYVTKLSDQSRKPNVEQGLASRFTRMQARAQQVLQKANIPLEQARMIGMLFEGGIQDNTVNRLLLMSSSENHLPNVPMVFHIEPGKVAGSKN
ncbi:hypothetical protein TSA1_08240 [Bradyrhizobium nitroreducens]|uniref:DUF4238 domain-containing protein n=1 Tax=Bradyrhizobium nitroreducens TaxID=709803 RepID=A0A2M6U850_9BRAD|nr:DUF4238 domain-containing protein [Bradyrhizobium nitroreducens]PIT00763.1 hypothetical protein TSA1_08240 [Bradyrhizobium nitroreducens]